MKRLAVIFVLFAAIVLAIVLVFSKFHILRDPPWKPSNTVEFLGRDRYGNWALGSDEQNCLYVVATGDSYTSQVTFEPASRSMEVDIDGKLKTRSFNVESQTLVIMLPDGRESRFAISRSEYKELVKAARNHDLYESFMKILSRYFNKSNPQLVQFLSEYIEPPHEFERHRLRSQ